MHDSGRVGSRLPKRSSRAGQQAANQRLWRATRGADLGGMRGGMRACACARGHVQGIRTASECGAHGREQSVSIQIGPEGRNYERRVIVTVSTRGQFLISRRLLCVLYLRASCTPLYHPRCTAATIIPPMRYQTVQQSPTPHLPQQLMEPLDSAAALPTNHTTPHNIFTRWC